MGQEVAVERAPVGADAHRLAVPDGGLDDGRELSVLLVLEADIARIDAVLVERLGAGRMIGQKLVADVMEIADERHVDSHLGQPVADVGHGGGRLVPVHRDAHDLRTRAGQRRHLPGRALDVGRVGVGHRLHDHRGPTADHDIAHPHADGLAPGQGAGSVFGDRGQGIEHEWASPLAQYSNGVMLEKDDAVKTRARASSTTGLRFELSRNSLPDAAEGGNRAPVTLPSQFLTLVSF